MLVSPQRVETNGVSHTRNNSDRAEAIRRTTAKVAKEKTMAEKPILDRLLERYGYGDNAEVDPRDIDYEAARKLFQRDLKPRDWETFVPVLFGRPIVAEVKNGRRKAILVPLDGQHRFHEAIQVEEYAVPCVLYRGMAPEDVAAVFDILNSDRKSLPAPDEFRAACLSGAEAAVALDKALLERGLDGWCRRDGYKRLTVIGSVRVLQNELGRESSDGKGQGDPETGLERTLYALDTIRQVWPWDGPDAVAKSPHTRVVQGFGQFLRPEKVRPKAGDKVGAKFIYRWDRENTGLLVEHLRVKYNVVGGLYDLLEKAEKLAPARAGGAGSVGMQWALDDEFRIACRNAGLPTYRPEVKKVTRKAKAEPVAAAAAEGS